MATDKHTVSIYVDQDLLEKLNEFKIDGSHKSLNVALNKFLRESFLGEVSGNMQSKVQSNVQSTLDIDSSVNVAVESRLEAVLSQVRDLELKVHSQETYSLLYTSLKADVDIRFDETNKAIATLTSEAKESSKKSHLQIAREKVLAA